MGSDRNPPKQPYDSDSSKGKSTKSKNPGSKHKKASSKDKNGGSTKKQVNSKRLAMPADVEGGGAEGEVSQTS
jgi:hypothetical protein